MGSIISQKITKVLWEVNGSTKDLVKSGFKIMSESLIAFHPAIDEPSKKVPSFKNSASTVLTSWVKCWSFPLGSVNLKSTNSISLSLIVFKIFSAVIFISSCYFLSYKWTINTI